jgi:hypothetical protein
MDKLSRKEAIRRDRRKAAALYERTFGVPLAERIAGLLAIHPNVTAPNWLSWEGHRFTNAANTRQLRAWLADLT